MSLTTSVEPLEGNKVRLHVAIPAAEFEQAIDAAFRKLAQRGQDRRASVPARRRAACSRPASAPRSPATRRCATRSPSTTPRPSSPRTSTSSRRPRSTSPPARRRATSSSTPSSRCARWSTVDGLRRAARRDPSARGHRRGGRRADRHAARALRRPRGLRRRRSPTATTPRSTSRATSTTSRSRASPPPTTSTRSARASSSPKLDEELHGKRPGDILKFNDTLPERFGERAGEEVAFQVLVKEAKKQGAPRAHRRVGLRGQRVRHRRRAARRRRARASTSYARGAGADGGAREGPRGRRRRSSPIEVPETLVNQEMERRLHDLAHRLEEQGIGMTIPQYLAATGQDQQEFVDSVRDGAARGGARRPRAAGGRSPRRRSRRPTTSSTPRSTAWPSGSSEKPAKVRKDLERRGVLEAVRSDIARGKALAVPRRPRRQSSTQTATPSTSPCPSPSADDTEAADDRRRHPTAAEAARPEPEEEPES